MGRAKSVLTFVTGVPGVGKSYRQIYYIIKEIIPELREDAKIYTNLPLVKEKFVEYFEDESLNDRLVLISEEEQKGWRESKKIKGKADDVLGPWSYFRDKETSGCAFILDEIHELCRNTDPQAHKDRWEEFLATVRHLGFMSVEFLTQAEAEVARVIKSRAGIKVSLEDNESMLDKIFKIPLSDWYNLDAKYTGKYKKSYLESTYKKHDGRWSRKPMKSIRRYIDPKFFPFYDSYNHTAGTETTATKHEEIKPFQKHSFIGIHWWFIKRNFIELIYKGVLICFFFWFILLGGFQYCFTSFVSGLSGSLMNSKNTDLTPEEIKTKQIENLEFAKEVESKRKNQEQELKKMDSKESEQKETVQNKEVFKTVVEPVKVKPLLSKIVLITDHYIMTDDGKTLNVGDLFNKKKILKIDYIKRGIIDEDNNFTGFNR